MQANIETEPGALDALAQPTHAYLLGAILRLEGKVDRAQEDTGTWRREVFAPVAAKVDVLSTKMDENTELTQSIKDKRLVWKAIRTWFENRKWIGQTIAWVASAASALVILYYAVINKGAPPGGGVGP